MKEIKAKKEAIKPPTKLDMFLCGIAPGFARKRYAARSAMQALGSYLPKKGRGSITLEASGGDFDTDVLPELPDLRKESEDLYRKNPIAASVVNTETRCVIGSGLTAQPRIDAEFLGLTEEAAKEKEAIISRLWLQWSESKFCSINRKHNFRGHVRLAHASSLIRGDSFTLTPEEDPLPYFPFRLRVQLVEADRVCNEADVADTERLSGGIETNPNGSLRRAHIRTTHPGTSLSAEQKWTKVDFFGKETGRKNILHYYRSIRGDQSRGVPTLATLIDGLTQYGKLMKATVDAALIQTFLSILVTTESADGLDLPDGGTSASGAEVAKLGAAQIIDLMPGESATVVDPTHPNSNLPAFSDVYLTQLGAGAGIGKEVLSMHFSSSYTAAQGAMLETWRNFYMRRSDAVDDLCQPVYELFVSEIVADGRLDAPGFFTDPAIRAAYCGADWTGPKRGHIREDVQNRADGYAEDRGWKTGHQNASERGNRWDRVHAGRVQEINARKAAGIITNDEDLVDIGDIV